MSPKVKQSAINVSAMLGAVVAISGLMAPVARTVDARYVKSVTYSSDSINRFYRDQYISQKLAKIDSVNAKLDTIKAMLNRGMRR